MAVSLVIFYVTLSASHASCQSVDFGRRKKVAERIS